MNNSNSTHIIVALIGFFGLIIAAVIAVLPTFLKDSNEKTYVVRVADEVTQQGIDRAKVSIYFTNGKAPLIDRTDINGNASFSIMSDDVGSAREILIEHPNYNVHNQNVNLDISEASITIFLKGNTMPVSTPTIIPTTNPVASPQPISLQNTSTSIPPTDVSTPLPLPTTVVPTNTPSSLVVTNNLNCQYPPPIEDRGSRRLLLNANQIAVGTADRFQDVIDQTDPLPPFTIFAIYGPIDTELSIYWGGWDICDFATANDIDAMINQKVQDVIGYHPSDYKTRGYRVLECRGTTTDCTILRTFP